MYGQNSGTKWERMPSWRRSKSGHMKSSILVTHENCEASISLIRRTRNLRIPLRMLVRKWKHQLLLLCLAKLWRRIVGVVHHPTKLKQDLRVFWKLVHLQDCVWENHYQIIMKIILQKKETIQYSIITWFTNLVLSLKPKKSSSKSSSGQGMGNIGENFGVEPDKSQKQKRGDRWSKDDGRKSSLCITDGHMSFEKCWIGGKTPKIQRSSCTPRWYCKRRFRILRSIHRTRIISITNDGSQNHGYHLQIARLRWTSSRCSISSNPSENGRCSQIVENSQIGMSRHLDSSTTTLMA